VLAFVLLAFNLVYLYAPNIKHWAWHWMMPGTIVGVLLWLLGSFAFKLYLSFFNIYRVVYGSLGTVIILLLWFCLTSIAILIGDGAQTRQETDKTSGAFRINTLYNYEVLNPSNKVVGTIADFVVTPRGT
jgi:membrane protein